MQSSTNSTVSNISRHSSSMEGMEFDFELCHMQYSYCCCW